MKKLNLLLAIFFLGFISIPVHSSEPKKSQDPMEDPWLKHQLRLLVEENKARGYELKKLKIEDLWQVNEVCLVMATDSVGKKYRFITEGNTIASPCPEARRLFYGYTYDLLVKPKNEYLRNSFVTSFSLMFSDKVKDLTICFPFEEDIYLVYNLVGEWVIPLKEFDIEEEK